MRKGLKFILIITTFSIVLFLVYFWGREYIDNYFFKLKLTDFIEPLAGSKVLIIAPHCDDETLGTGELISRMSKKGVDFKVVLMTNGDGFTDALEIAFHEVTPKPEDYIKFGYLRQKESIKALEYLGLNQNKIIFLGYPDGGLYNMWSMENWNIPYQSIHTGKSSTPYNNSYVTGAPYTGRNVVNDLLKIIGDYSPDFIFYPHPNDRHHDHMASYCYTKYVLNKLNLPIKEYLYLVHRGDWPVMTPNHNKLYLIPPYTLANDSAWYGFDLSNQETAEKVIAIDKYKSQVNAMGPRLRAFARKNELYALYPKGTIKNINSEPNKYNNYLLEYDPTSDVLPSSIQTGGDLKALYGYQLKDGSFKFFIKANGDIKQDVKYLLDIILFDGSIEIRRLSLSVNEEKISADLMTDNKIESIKDITYIIDKQVLQIFIPGKFSQGVNKCFVGVTSSIYGVRLDNMAWGMYEIIQE